MEIITIVCIVLFGQIIRAESPPGVCESEIRELKPRFGPYIETYTEFYRTQCPPPRYGICIFSRVGSRHAVGLQHEIRIKKIEKCCVGYRQTVLYPIKCEPVCILGCINGICKNPEECECKKGYEQKLHNMCTPVCTEECINSTCTAPDTCTCKPGYAMNSKNECEPVCKNGCTNGVCMSPDECVCKEGYKQKLHNMCTPVCTKECINSTCTAPDTCTCKSGYVMNSKNECEPVCKNECTNGVCMSPDECVCKVGYRKSDLVNSSNICIPVCTLQCINGVCIAPDQCMCFPDYVKKTLVKNWFTSNICIPACANCTNGYCTEGNVCKCNENYEKNKNVCKPICKRTCVNGYCSKPDECTCNDGYEQDLENPYLCNPKCMYNCENGKCTAPEECSCFEGYAKENNDSYVCKPICEEVCQNGSCINSVCICDKGFVLDEIDKYKCILQTEKLVELTPKEEEEEVDTQTKLPCIFNVRNAIKTESISSCILFNENMVIKTKYVCRYLNKLTKNICVNIFCEEHDNDYFCKSFLNCYVITEYKKSLGKNVYSFDCNLGNNVTQYDYAVDLNDTINESNFTAWFDVEMKIDWFDFNAGIIKPFVVIDDTESNEDSCEWCLCPVDLRPKCDGTPFQLHICSCPRKSAHYSKPSHISVMHIFLATLGGLSVLVGFITVIILTGHYLWMRHREKNDPLKYKEQEMSCKFDNVTFNNTTRELISDDEDSDEDVVLP